MTYEQKLEHFGRVFFGKTITYKGDDGLYVYNIKFIPEEWTLYPGGTRALVAKVLDGSVSVVSMPGTIQFNDESSKDFQIDAIRLWLKEILRKYFSLEIPISIVLDESLSLHGIASSILGEQETRWLRDRPDYPKIMQTLRRRYLGKVLSSSPPHSIKIVDIDSLADKVLIGWSDSDEPEGLLRARDVNREIENYFGLEIHWYHVI